MKTKKTREVPPFMWLLTAALTVYAIAIVAMNHDWLAEIPLTFVFAMNIDSYVRGLLRQARAVQVGDVVRSNGPQGTSIEVTEVAGAYPEDLVIFSDGTHCKQSDIKRGWRIG